MDRNATVDSIYIEEQYLHLGIPRSGLFGRRDSACYFVDIAGELQCRSARQGLGPEAIAQRDCGSVSRKGGPERR